MQVPRDGMYSRVSLRHAGETTLRRVVLPVQERHHFLTLSALSVKKDTFCHFLLKTPLNRQATLRYFLLFSVISAQSSTSTGPERHVCAEECWHARRTVG